MHKADWNTCLPSQVNACTSAFYQPILVSQFLGDQQTFRNLDERKAQLRGLRVQVMYDPKWTGGIPRSKAAMIKARIKTIVGTGQAVCQQKFGLNGGDGQPDVATTVQSYFRKSRSFLHFSAVEY
jgi:eukaryotic translation initiation factor 2C